MSAAEMTGFALWVMLSVIWLVVLNYRQEAFERRCQELKEKQDRISEKFLEYAEQINKDMEKLEDRAAKIEKELGSVSEL